MSITPLVDIGLDTKERLLFAIAKEISAAVGHSFLNKVYIAIVDTMGTIQHIDTPAFDQYLYFIQNYVKENFHILEVGDHSIPFGGISLAFFKVSPKAIIILYSKGPSGQLLTFKPKMFMWTKRIDELVGEVETETYSTLVSETNLESESGTVVEASETPVKKREQALKRVPLLIKPLSGKEKFPLEVTRVLQYCDGTYSIEEICEETGYSRLKVDLIIKKYNNKKWITIQRIL